MKHKSALVVLFSISPILSSCGAVSDSLNGNIVTKDGLTVTPGETYVIHIASHSFITPFSFLGGPPHKAIAEESVVVSYIESCEKGYTTTGLKLHEPITNDTFINSDSYSVSNCRLSYSSREYTDNVNKLNGDVYGLKTRYDNQMAKMAKEEADREVAIKAKEIAEKQADEANRRSAREAGCAGFYLVVPEKSRFQLKLLNANVAPQPFPPV